MRTLRFHPRRWTIVLTPVLLMLVGALILFAQIDMTGYWAFRVKDGGVNYFQLQQTGENVTSVSTGGRGGGRGGRGLTGTLRGGKLHLVSTFNMPAQGPAPAAGQAPGAGQAPARPPAQARETVYDGVVENANRIAVTVQTSGREPLRGTLERVTREETFPARIPPPDLRDVPDNGLARTPPMGWNSWNKFQDVFDDATVRQMADAMVSSGMSKAGYTYIVVDEGWSSGRDANGNIVGNGKFPDMKALANYVHSKGLKIGIYSSPGPQSCSGRMGGGYQGSFGHEEQDARTFGKWGYDYLKYDWCSAGSVYSSTREDNQGAYQKMGEALLKTGRPIVYSLCQYGMHDVWKWGAKAGGNLWRTTDDIADRWDSMERIGFAQIDIAGYNQPGHWNDPDMLEVGNGGMTADEYRTHMSLWCLLSAPLMAGNDLRTMAEETKSILMNPDVIAIDQDRDPKPVQRLSQAGKSEVLVRPLSGNAFAVGLFNRGDKPAEISFRWDALKFDTGLYGFRRLQAQDLWKHEPVQVSGDTYTATVPSHGVVLLRVSIASGRGGFGL
ncbi:MAG: glycoside hydrolase family 27 protein [Bryobacteraceae bacterium]